MEPPSKSITQDSYTETRALVDNPNDHLKRNIPLSFKTLKKTTNLAEMTWPS